MLKPTTTAFEALASEGYAALRDAVMRADEQSGADAVSASLTLTITEAPSGPGWRPLDRR